MSYSPWDRRVGYYWGTTFSFTLIFVNKCLRTLEVCAAAAAKSLQSCPTLCDPIDGSPPGSPVPGILQARTHQAPPSLGFSRQEHWSELPFPSLMQESEKLKWSRSVVPDLQGPHGPQPTRLLRPWDFPGKSTGVGCHCLLREVCEQMLNGLLW